MKVYFIGGSAGTGKSYLTKKLSEASLAYQYHDMLVSETLEINQDTTSLVVDHLHTDAQLEQINDAALNGNIQNLIIVGQSVRDYEHNFDSHIIIKGAPGSRIFEVHTESRVMSFKESEINQFPKLLH